MLYTALLTIIFLVTPVTGLAEVTIDLPEVGNVLPGPATGLFELLEGLKDQVRAKMDSFTPKIENSIGGVKNTIQQETGLTSFDSFGSTKSWIEDKTSYFNSDAFIARASAFLGDVLKKVIELTKSLVSAL
jgi:hypothetical protein